MSSQQKYKQWIGTKQPDQDRKVFHVGTDSSKRCNYPDEFGKRIDAMKRKRNRKLMWKVTSRRHMRSEYATGLWKEYRKFFEPIEGGDDACTQQHSNYKVFRKRRTSIESTTVQTRDRKLSNIDKPALQHASVLPPIGFGGFLTTCNLKRERFKHKVPASTYKFIAPERTATNYIIPSGFREEEMIRRMQQKYDGIPDHSLAFAFFALPSQTFARSSRFEKDERFTIQRPDLQQSIERGKLVAQKFYKKIKDKLNNELHMPPVPLHLQKLYQGEVLQSPSWTNGNLKLIHELNLTATHTNKTKYNELQNINGLLGMQEILASLKSNLALPCRNRYSTKTTLQYVHEQFNNELQRRYRQFQWNLNKQLERHCKAYIYACSNSKVYSEPLEVRVDKTVIKIASEEHDSCNEIKELQECTRRFVHLKHFLETCDTLLKKAKQEPVCKHLEKFIQTQMNFGEKQSLQSESKFANELMDLAWLLQRCIRYSVYWQQQKKVSKPRGKKPHDMDKIIERKAALVKANEQRQELANKLKGHFGGHYKGLSKKVETFTVLEDGREVYRLKVEK